MKGYKGFNKGLICHGKQYAENTVFEEDVAVVCQKGMHFCVDPLEVLNYYPMLNKNGEENEFAEVEALDEPVTDDGKIYASKKLKILKKINIDELFAAATKQMIESGEASDSNNGYYAQIGSSGDYAQIWASGLFAQIGSSGDYAKIGSSGRSARIGSSGDSARIGASGDYAKIGSSGEDAKIRSSGRFAQIGSSGRFAQIGSSGDYAQIGSSGDYAQIWASVEDAQIGSSGRSARIGSSGRSARIGSSGDSAKIISSGKNAVICCAGQACAVKGKKGSWITLAEWKWIKEEYVPVCVKTRKIDGVKIKEDTFYILKNKKFTELSNVQKS